MTFIFKLQFYISNHFRQVVCTKTIVTIHKNAIVLHTVYG